MNREIRKGYQRNFVSKTSKKTSFLFRSDWTTKTILNIPTTESTVVESSECGLTEQFSRP